MRRSKMESYNERLEMIKREHCPCCITQKPVLKYQERCNK